MRVLVYKRTHQGDPDSEGRFGVYDCMGTIRNREFDAVIGVGALGAEAQRHGIDGKINWIGIGPHKTASRSKRASTITFDHFLDFGTDGPAFDAIAPKLAGRMYRRRIRHLIDGIREDEVVEVMRILELAKRAPASKRRPGGRQVHEGDRPCATRFSPNGCKLIGDR
jgi:hypothetical protein